MLARLGRASVVTLGFGLVLLGGAKLRGLEQAVAPLVTLGLPTATFGWIGWGEILVGLALTQYRLHFWGGLALAGWMLGAVATHLRAGDQAGALVTIILAVVGVATAVRAGRTTRWPSPLSHVPDGVIRSIAFAVRHVGIAILIRWAVGGMLFWAALPLLAYSHARHERVETVQGRLHLILLYLLFYGFGAGGVWNFMGHVFMADQVASSVGWAAGTGFQTELGFYALGTGIVGLLAHWIRDRFWIAAAVAPCIFVYGAAYTHIRDYLTTGNDAPMNWSAAAVGANLVIPTIVLGVVWAYARAGGLQSPRTE